jgi:hypothetical protein
MYQAGDSQNQALYSLEKRSVPITKGEKNNAEDSRGTHDFSGLHHVRDLGGDILHWPDYQQCVGVRWRRRIAKQIPEAMAHGGNELERG